MNLTPLKQRIVEALAATPRRRMNYSDLAYKLWPPEQHPKAWRYSANGGPHGWAMPLGRALRELRASGIAYESRPRGGGAGHGDVVLLTPNMQVGVDALSIHSTKAGALKAKAEYEKPRLRNDGTSYILEATVEECDVQE